MNDLKPFKHGEEGTHYVCQEVLELKGGKATCCGCSGHKCKKPKPMKRIKKECNCHCHNEFHWFINDKDSCAGITECPHCSPKPMKRIKKERTHNIEDTHYACNEQMERLGADTPCCICFGHKCKQLKAIKKECDACKPREHGIVIVEKVEEGGRCIQCRRIVCSPKPTKIKKKLVIKEEWCETTFEQQKDRLYVHMRYFEDDDSGGKWEGGSSSFSVPLKKLKDYLLSH